MKCPPLMDIDLYLETELESWRQNEIKAHLDACASCRELAVRRRQLLLAFSTLPPVKIPEKFVETLIDKLPEFYVSRTKRVLFILTISFLALANLGGLIAIINSLSPRTIINFWQTITSLINSLGLFMVKLIKAISASARILFEFASLIFAGVRGLVSSTGLEVIIILFALGLILIINLLAGLKKIFSSGVNS